MGSGGEAKTTANIFYIYCPSNFITSIQKSIKIVLNAPKHNDVTVRSISKTQYRQIIKVNTTCNQFLVARAS